MGYISRVFVCLLCLFLSSAFADLAPKRASDLSWLYGDWTARRVRRKGGSARDFAVENALRPRRLSFSKTQFAAFGEKCANPVYGLKSYDVREGNVPTEDVRHTAWFAGDNDVKPELVIISVGCAQSGKDWVFERTADHGLALVGSSMTFFFQKK